MKQGKIEVIIITGFLGAGKTTVLNHLTNSYDLKNSAILINEFGEIGIDHHLVKKINDNILLLDSGCLCCTVQGEFVDALRDLHGKLSRGEIPELKRIIIETTGLADPLPIIRTIMQDRFISTRFYCGGVWTIVDAQHIAKQLEKHDQALKQIAIADVLIITKSDLCPDEQIQSLKTKLDKINPTAKQIYSIKGKISENIFALGAIYNDGNMPNLSQWFGDEGHEDCDHEHNHEQGHCHHVEHNHNHEIQSFTHEFANDVPWYGFSLVISDILRKYSEKLIRIKGLVNSLFSNHPIVIQCVQDEAYPPVILSQWPEDTLFAEHHGRLVFIGNNMSANDIDDIKNMLSNIPSDAYALRKKLSDNNIKTRNWFNIGIMASTPNIIVNDDWIIKTPRFSKCLH